MRRSAVVLAVALTIVLAGCTGFGVDKSSVDGIDQTSNEQANSSTPEDEDANQESDSTDGATSEPNTTSDTNATVDGELQIHHIDVGQADSTLLITPDGETILIDSGDWRQSGQGVIDYLENHDIERIDHLVATHAHADHIGGHDEIIEHYETEHDGVGAAYDSGVASTSNTYDRYLDAVETYEVDLFEVREGDELPIDDDALEATVLNPEGGTRSDLHASSVTIVFEFGEFQYVTTGDAESDVEDRLADDWNDQLDADAYQAGHHGSSTSSTEPFMDTVDPSIAVISSDYDSQYGHPNDDTLERFADLNIETYWTGVHGDIVLTTDGESTDVETESEFSTDPLDILDETPSDDSDTETQQITVDAFDVAPTPLAP